MADPSIALQVFRLFTDPEKAVLQGVVGMLIQINTV